MSKAPLNVNLTELAKTISPEDFEIFLRHYVQRQFKRFVNSEPNSSLLMYVASCGYGKGTDIQNTHWALGISPEQTNGEILDGVIGEHIRRADFKRTYTLRLLEGKAEASPA